MFAAQRNSGYENIAGSVIGCVFLGTPHHGATGILPVLGSWKALSLTAFGARRDLLELLRDSNQLRTMDHEFRRTYETLDCASFYECQPEYVTLGIPFSIGPVRSIQVNKQGNSNLS